MGMIRLLAIYIIFFSFTFLGSVYAYGVTCGGNRTCAPGAVCLARENILTKQVEYQCASQNEIFGGNQNVDAGQSQNTNAAQPQMLHCDGPCRTGGAQELINGRCVCPSEVQQSTGPSCTQQLQALQQKCQESLQDTTYFCDEKNDAGMNNLSTLGSQLTLMTGAQASASIQAACSKMADFTQAANAALAAYRLTCNNYLGSCRSDCAAVKSYIETNTQCLFAAGASVSYSSLIADAEGEQKKCDQYVSKVNEAERAIQNYGATSMNASQCSELSAGTSTAQTELCKANPTHPSCNPTGPVDCSNPQVAATNKVCVCAKNPQDPMCSGAQKAGGGSTISSSVDSSSRLGAGAGSNFDFNGDIPGLPSITPGKPSSGGGEGIDGSQGGGTVGGGGSGGGGVAGSGSGGGGAGSDENAGVLNGFYGGGGMGAGAYGRSGGGSGGGGRGGYAGAAAGAQGPAGPDLRKFLPGGQFDPKRGVSGVGGPDGITGPHSNIWQKIQNRYQVMSPSLLP